MNPELLQQLQQLFLAGSRLSGAGMDPRQKLMQAQQGLRGMTPPAVPSQGAGYAAVNPSTMPVLQQQPQGQATFDQQARQAAPSPAFQQDAARAMPPMAQGQPMGQPMGGMRPAVKPVVSAAPAGLAGGPRPMVKAAPMPQPAGLAGRVRPAVKAPAPAPAPMSRGPAAPRRYK